MDSNPNFNEDPEDIPQEPLATPDPSQIPVNPPEQPPTPPATSDVAPGGGGPPPQMNTISAQQPPQPIQAPAPPAGGLPRRRKRWWPWIVGILLALILIGGGLALASYMGFLVLGLEELWGGVSRNPYKALVQTAEKVGEVKEVSYESDLAIKLRSGSEIPELTEANTLDSLSSTTLSYFTNVLDFPSRISGQPSRVLGEYTSIDSRNFEIGLDAKSTEKAASFQISYELTNESELQSFEQYLEPLTNSENQVVVDSVSDLEKNFIYFKVSSLETEGENPWVKSALPESYYKDEDANFQEKWEKEIGKLKKLDMDDFKDAFKVAQNQGVRDINGHKTYLFKYIVSAKKLTELYAKMEGDTESDIAKEEDYDIEMNLWVGINDRFIYKAETGFTTKESYLGSVTLEFQTTLEYQDVQITIPSLDEDIIDDVCQHPALKHMEIIKSYCAYSQSYTPADTAQTRDTQRKADLRNIQVALEEYKDEHGKYPICESICKTNDSDSVVSEVLKGYISTIPVDPLDPQYFYGYLSNSDGSKYRLTCVMEDESRSNFELNGTKLYKLGNL